MTDKLNPVIYDVMNEEHRAIRHVEYRNGETVVESKYNRQVRMFHNVTKRDIAKIEERIIGGEPVNIKQYPFFVSLHSHSHDQHMCGKRLK